MPVQSIRQSFTIHHYYESLVKNNITPSYFLCAPWVHDSIRSIRYVKIQPGVGDSSLAEVPIELGCDERIEGFQLDEAQNLLAAVTTCKSYPNQVLLRLSNFPDGEPYPLAAVQNILINLPFPIIGDDIVQVQINQNLIGILIADRGASQGSHFTLLNWKTGEPIVPLHSETGNSMKYFSFLSPSNLKIVFTNRETHTIEVWTFRERSMQKILSLEIPYHGLGIEYQSLDCTKLNPDQLSPSSFSPERACIAFQLLSCPSEGDISYNGTTFILSAAYLLQHEAAGSIPWEAWGPGNTQLLETTHSADNVNTGGPLYLLKTMDEEHSDLSEDTEHRLTIYDVTQPPRVPQVHMFMVRRLIDKNTEQTIDVFADLVLGSKPRILEPSCYWPCNIILNQGQRLFALTDNETNCTTTVQVFHF